MKLRDRLPKGGSDLRFSPNGHGNSGGDHSGKSGNKSDHCKLLNRGYCKYGAGCKFEHKCSYCEKFGHPILSCRKLQADKERAKQRRSTGNGSKQNGQQDHSE